MVCHMIKTHDVMMSYNYDQNMMMKKDEDVRSWCTWKLSILWNEHFDVHENYLICEMNVLWLTKCVISSIFKDWKKCVVSTESCRIHYFRN